MKNNIENRKIIFKSKERKMLEEMLNAILKKVDSKESARAKLADRFGTTARNMQRWINGDTTPAYAIRKYIGIIYRGLKNKGEL